MLNEELVELFLLSLKAQHLSPRTIKAYSADLRSFQRFLGATRFGAVDTNQLREFLSGVRGAVLCSTTIRRRLATLRRFFKFLVNEGLIDQEPTVKLTGRVHTPRRLPRVLASKEIIKLLRTAARHAKLSRTLGVLKAYQAYRNYLLIEVLFCTGIRVDEAVSLTLNDIDKDTGVIRVLGKGRKERQLFISSREVLKELCLYLAVRRAMRSESDSLFLNRFGHRLGPNSIGKVFRALLGLAGISERYTPHCLRHTMATCLIENGADVRTVQEILGHSSITTTELYLSVTNERKRKATRQFNQRDRIRLS